MKINKQSGYQGKSDILRDRANKLLGAEFSKSKKDTPPESLMSPGNTKMRRFAGGGTAGAYVNAIGNLGKEIYRPKKGLGLMFAKGGNLPYKIDKAGYSSVSKDGRDNTVGTPISSRIVGHLGGKLINKAAGKLPFGKNIMGTGASLGDVLEGAFNGFSAGASTRKKGGSVKVRGVTKEQSDMYIPKRVKSSIPKQVLLESAFDKKRGGSVMREEERYCKKHGKGRKGIGGSIIGGAASPLVRSAGNRRVKSIAGTGVGLGDVLSSMVGTGSSFLPFKKGGKVRKYADGGGVPGIDYVAKKGGHMQKSYKAQKSASDKKHGKGGRLFGGAVLGTMGGAALKPFINKIPVVGGVLGSAAPMVGGAMGGMLPFRKGGHAKASGGAMRKASGGSVYESQMVGERPSRKAPRNNYESEMRGERPIKKMAAGGVGKIRHKQATAFGMPIKSKHRSRSV